MRGTALDEERSMLLERKSFEGWGIKQYFARSLNYSKFEGMKTKGTGMLLKTGRMHSGCQPRKKALMYNQEGTLKNSRDQNMTS